MSASINERASLPIKLSRDSKAYQRVLELLEANTFTWIVDAWLKNPTREAINESKLKHMTHVEAIELARKFGLSPEKCVKTIERRRSQTLLHVNGECCTIEQAVMNSLRKALQ